MFLKRSLIAVIFVIGIVFAVSVFIALSGNIAIAQEDEFHDLCGNNDEFTQDFLIDSCKFKARGYNPYFILLPGFQFILETPEEEDERERAVVTVLRETKKIDFDGRRIKTSVVEERALEWEEAKKARKMSGRQSRSPLTGLPYATRPMMFATLENGPATAKTDLIKMTYVQVKRVTKVHGKLG